MSTTSDRLARWLWQARFALLGLAIVLTGLAGAQLSSLSVSNSLEIWYPGDDPALARYRDFQRTFGNDEIVVVTVTGSDRFDQAEGREQVAEITDRLYVVDGVRSVSSITTVPEAMAIARDRLLSDDGRTAAFIVQLGDVADAETRRHEILDDLRVAASRSGLETRLAGYGVIYDTLNQASTEGAASLLLAGHLLMLLLLAVLLRRFSAVLVTIVVVAAATVWTMGLYAYLGETLNMVTMALPTLVLVIAIADCVHVLRAVAREPEAFSRSARAIRGMRAVIAPCALTSVTTAAGFLALTVSELPIVVTLGQFGAIGMLAAFAATFLILPAGLSLPRLAPSGNEDRLDRWTLAAHDAGRRRPWIAVGGFALMMILSLGGMRLLETDTYSIGYLSDRHQTRLDSDFVEAEIGPYAPIDVLVSAENVLDAALLDDVQAFQRTTGELDDIHWSWSLLDALEIDADTPPSSLGSGDIGGRLARLRLLAPDIADTMIAGEHTLRLSFGAPMMSARQVQALIRDIEARADFAEGVDVRADGYAVLYTRIVDRIVRAQTRGFAIAFLIIGATIALATRSPARLLLAIPATLIPVIGTLGLMGWLGVPLDVATATIATVILGLIVDDTVHMLRPGEGSIAGSVRRNVARAGGALAVTSIVLIGGFLVLGTADLRSVAWFGGLSAFAMALALATDLLLLPALLELCTGRGARARSPAPTGISLSH